MTPLSSKEMMANGGNWLTGVIGALYEVALHKLEEWQNTPVEDLPPC